MKFQITAAWLSRLSQSINQSSHQFVWLLQSSNGTHGWLGSRVVSVLDSGAEGPGFKSQSLNCRVTVLGKLFTPIVPLFTKQQNWQQESNGSLPPGL